MFDGNVTNQFPHSIADCNREDPVAASLWKWARVIRYLSVVLPILTFIVTAVYVGVMSNYVGEGAGYEFLPIGIITGVALFIAMLLASVLLSAAARIVQNTSITANVEILRLSMESEKQPFSQQPIHTSSPSAVKQQTVVSPAVKMQTSVVTASKRKSAFLGRYWQSNTGEKDVIEWLVLNVQGDKSLVVSRYALTCKPYNDSRENVTWETCSLRKWLNGTFINNAFSEEEKSMIQRASVRVAGNNVVDKVFLLSVTEANQYLRSNISRQCEGTAFCYSQGANETKNGNCCWWLRTPGFDDNCAAYVFDDGDISDDGIAVNADKIAVRPAMWIKLD